MIVGGMGENEERGPEEVELIWRVDWFIRLRWVAAAGVFLAIAFADRILAIPLPLARLYGIAFFLAGYNAAFSIYSRKLRLIRPLAALSRATNVFANIQISLDLISLTLLLHYSGGIENPFIFYYIFHMIIAGILLSRRASYCQATFAVALFAGMAAGEYRGNLAHACLQGHIGTDLHDKPLHVFGTVFAFGTTLYLAVYMATDISNRLREKSANLAKANMRLKEHDRLKSEYVLRVSHNIKAHLAAIQSCLNVLLRGIAGRMQARQEELVRRAERRTVALLEFVSELLDLTALKLRPRLDKGRVRIEEAVGRVTDALRDKAGAGGIEMKCSLEAVPLVVEGNKADIEELLAVLLSNSIKYTPPGGRIEIKAQKREDRVLVEVRDTGIGIDSEDLPKIFDEFYRAGNAVELVRDGTGLGLSIARQIVERHGGRIWARSAPGMGSSFFFSLPSSG